MYFHRNAITTGLTAPPGAKKIVRSTLRLLIRVCTPSASTSPIAFCTITMNTVSLIVFTSDPKRLIVAEERLEVLEPDPLVRRRSPTSR